MQGAALWWQFQLSATCKLNAQQTFRSGTIRVLRTLMVPEPVALCLNLQHIREL